MPKGVEHSASMWVVRKPGRVILPVMPKGVEHQFAS